MDLKLKLEPGALRALCQAGRSQGKEVNTIIIIILITITIIIIIYNLIFRFYGVHLIFLIIVKKQLLILMILSIVNIVQLVQISQIYIKNMINHSFVVLID